MNMTEYGVATVGIPEAFDAFVRMDEAGSFVITEEKGTLVPI
jgi:hypothetical protein